MRDRIPVHKQRIPYQFDILMGSETFTLRFDYNAFADLFTVSAYRQRELICANEPLIYGTALWSDCYQAGHFPCLTLIPFDESGQEHAVTWKNFGETVFLCIEDEPR